MDDAAIDAWHDAMNDKYEAVAAKAPDMVETGAWWADDDYLASTAYDADGNF
jgi:hypothetical protein